MIDMETKTRDICEMKETLMTAVKAELAKGLQQANGKELGEAVDMIKDLACAEKDCLEAHYYKTVVEAMETGGEEEEPRFGYNPTRYPRRGMKYKPMVDQEPYIDRYIDEHGGHMLDDMRMGYTQPRDSRGQFREDPEGRYGRAYRDYQAARRHYTATNSPADKEEMTTHATEHVADTIATIRELWRNADVDLKKRMKTDFTNLLGEMNV